LYKFRKFTAHQKGNRQISHSTLLIFSIVQIPSSPISSSVGQFAAARGVPQKSEIQNGPDLESVEEKDKLWFTIMSRAVARCGNDPTKIASYMRALVEGVFI
jgi:hypothetical protein